MLIFQLHIHEKLMNPFLNQTQSKNRKKVSPLKNNIYKSRNYTVYTQTRKTVINVLSQYLKIQT